jgi:small subunit ribosomal protein S6
MNNYEVVFVSTPVLSTDQHKAVVTKYSGLITDNGGTITNTENWGLRQLAYPIEKKTTGFYTLIEFASNPEFIKKLEVEFKRDENIMRFLSTRLDKHALAYNEKRKIRLANKTAEKAEKQEA